jgi:ribosome-associated protein
MSKKIEGEKLAIACAKAANEMQAEDIRVWKVKGISSISDYMVVCSGSSMPHLRAILRDVAGHVEEWHGVKPPLSEGKADSRWVVLDYIDVMVHVMHSELREFYAIEKLWEKGEELFWHA